MSAARAGRRTVVKRADFHRVGRISHIDNPQAALAGRLATLEELKRKNAGGEGREWSLNALLERRGRDRNPDR